jgi:uncharacterized protein (DUF608 family)
MNENSGCGCSGNMCCGKTTASKSINRRQFIKTTAAAAGGAGMLMSAQHLSAQEQKAFEAWNESLLDRGGQRWHRGDELTHIAMPMGGIGAGQVFLTGRGALDHWQIVNNFNGNARVPGSFFGIWAKTRTGEVTAKLLESGDQAPRGVDAVEFSGEYPFAWIRYQDTALPVQVSLECSSPLIPLNAKDSALPAVLFRFTIKNSAPDPVDAAVMAAAPNLVGWDGYAALDDTRYMGYIGNTNRLEVRDGAAVLRLESGKGAMANIDQPAMLVTNVSEVAYAMQLCENLNVRLHPRLTEANQPTPALYWIGALADDDARSGLTQILNQVHAGASVILTGDPGSLLAALAGGTTREGKPIAFNSTAANAWREALPFVWNHLKFHEQPVTVDPGSPLFNGLAAEQLQAPYHWSGEELQLKPHARVLVKSDTGAALVLEGMHGDGRIVVCLAPVHAAFDPFDRKTVIGNLVAGAGGASYTPQTGWQENAPFWGTMALAALDAGDRVSAITQWDDRNAVWQDFAADGRFEAAPSNPPSAPGTTWNGALSVPITLEPGEEQQITFALTWHFPNRMRDARYGLGPQPPQFDHRLGNQYNNWFNDACEVIDYVVHNLERLDRDTRAFHHAFYDSTLPRWLLDAVSANISIIRSPIIMWLEDGTVAGFEGSDACCPMNCTHVYNYAMATAFIFPELERNVREVDLLRQMHPDAHFIPHRTLLPLSLPRLGNVIAGPLHHAFDGELGTILKTCREWRVSGDTEWLTTLWPNAKKVMRHVLDEHDEQRDGVIRGEQPNTYDIHTYGSNTFIGSLYLAALRATEEMALHMGDAAFARECRERFDKGRIGYDEACWDGEYYRHQYDAPQAWPGIYEEENSWGPGCHADQLLGQWWAHILGLGYVLPPERVKQALHAIHHYNWHKDLSDHEHDQRVYAEGRESGLLNCTWPKGGRPQKPIKYCDEVWTGIEYHVAASLIREGLVTEGLQIARAARDRYTGNQRNPWSELECGGHYARAMASYSLLLAAAAFDAHAAAGKVAFAPRLNQDAFKAFFTTGKSWGTIAQYRDDAGQRNEVRVAWGHLELEQLEIEIARGEDPGMHIEVTGPGTPKIRDKVLHEGTCLLVFDNPVTLQAGDTFEVRVS